MNGSSFDLPYSIGSSDKPPAVGLPQIESEPLVPLVPLVPVPTESVRAAAAGAGGLLLLEQGYLLLPGAIADLTPQLRRQLDTAGVSQGAAGEYMLPELFNSGIEFLPYLDQPVVLQPIEHGDSRVPLRRHLA